VPIADPVAVARAWALTHPDVVRLAGEGGVADALPGDRLSLVLTAAGGQIGQYPGETLPRVLAACWDAPDGDGTDALALAGALVELVDTAPWTTPDGDVDVVMAWLEAHPSESPDPTSGRRRWLLTLRLHLWAHP